VRRAQREGDGVQTIYDLVTVAIFAGLIVLFLQRSTGEVQVDRVIDYLPPALGCAVGNYLGNHDYVFAAIAVIAAVPIYIWFVLKPLKH
jgi:hypothetical protein